MKGLQDFKNTNICEPRPYTCLLVYEEMQTPYLMSFLEEVNFSSAMFGMELGYKTTNILWRLQTFRDQRKLVSFVVALTYLYSEILFCAGKERGECRSVWVELEI